MKLIEKLATEYSNHESTCPMNDYMAGFRKARDMIMEFLDAAGPGAADTLDIPRDLGEEEVE